MRSSDPDEVQNAGKMIKGLQDVATAKEKKRKLGKNLAQERVEEEKVIGGSF